MFRNRIGRLTLCFSLLLSTALISRPAQAANIPLQGSINTDDDVQLFAFTVATAGSVDLRSYGYAGGTIPQDGGFSLGVARGGFDTILT
ncbi:MAG: DVUA0089 family protein, partial [Acidobacteriaceae bacterium]|nr:DVUA0089 family protein [Acidobacteriaceae bacterium]